MLTGIFTPSDCAKCKLCCNFHRQTAWETPALENEQIFLMQEMCIPLIKRPDGTTTFYLHFTSDKEDEVANCPALDMCHGCILPREQRPFECRIWPVRVMRDKNTLVIGIYENCPALHDDVFEKLKNHTLENLLPEILAYAKRQPNAVREFDCAYRIIWRA
ncbi:MAG: hypothetical protein Q4F38_05405 [Akkermansia sp.]|nr:hypothetical protein [Akkermansia sp.]